MNDIYQRAAAVHEIQVDHRAFTDVIEGVREAVLLSAYTPIVECVLLVGDPGTGKTSVCASLLEAYSQTSGRTTAYVTSRVGAIYVEIPSPATIDGIASVILKAMNDPFPNSGSPMARTERIVQLVNKSGTQLVILDEFHNLFSLEHPKRSQSVCDWLRGLINNLRATLVLVGTPNCTALVDGDRQLGHRFTYRFALSDIPVIDGEVAALQKYLSTFSGLVPQYTGVKSCPLFAEKLLALRMLAVTGANPRAISHMYKFAVLAALKLKGFDGHLTLDHFRTAAYNPYFDKLRLVTQNPFELEDSALRQQLAGKI